MFGIFKRPAGGSVLRCRYSYSNSKLRRKARLGRGWLRDCGVDAEGMVLDRETSHHQAVPARFRSTWQSRLSSVRTTLFRLSKIFGVKWRTDGRR